MRNLLTPWKRSPTALAEQQTSQLTQVANERDALRTLCEELRHRLDDQGKQLVIFQAQVDAGNLMPVPFIQNAPTMADYRCQVCYKQCEPGPHGEVPAGWISLAWQASAVLQDWRVYCSRECFQKSEYLAGLTGDMPKFLQAQSAKHTEGSSEPDTTGARNGTDSGGPVRWNAGSGLDGGGAAGDQAVTSQSSAASATVVVGQPA